MKRISLLLIASVTALVTSLSARTFDFEGFDLPADTADFGPVPNGTTTETPDPFGPESGLLITTEGTWTSLEDTGLSLNNIFNDLQNPPGTTSFTFWNGLAASNIVDTTTPGLPNEGAAWPGGGATLSGETEPGGSYGVVFPDSESIQQITFESGMSPQGLYIANTTYAALAMRDGDAFAKQFEQGDWFEVLVTGLAEDDKITGQKTFFLADFRSTNPEEHYILPGWEWLDLREMGPETSKLRFSFYSSDTGDFGINTPTYVAIDNITFTASALVDAEPVRDGWSFLPWFGEFYDNDYPWLYSEDWGWLFLSEDSTPSEMNFYWDNFGWFYTRPDLYPWVYFYNDDAWLYYIKGTQNPWLFYDSETGEIVETDSAP